MKKIWILLIGLLLTACALCACESKEPQENDSGSGTAESTPVSEPVEPIPFSVGENASFKLVNGLKSKASNESVQSFIKNIERRTGAKLAVASTLMGASTPEIVIGSVANRAGSVEQLSAVDFDSVRVSVKDGNIYVSLYHDGFLDEALKELEYALKKTDEGNWVLAADFVFEKCYSSRTEALPAFSGAESRLEGVYSAGDDDYMAHYEKVKASDLETYRTALTDAGYTLFSENEAAGNRFAVYHKGESAVRLSFYPGKGQLKVLCGAKGYLPTLTQPTVTASVTPSVTQPGRVGASLGAPGMSYALQTSDGGFILIDGGPTDTNDVASLLSFLRENTPSGQKPLIHAWFFSHAHGDHMQLAITFLNTYAREITLELVCMNLPDFETIRFTNEAVSETATYEASLESVLRRHYKETPVYKFHSGDRFWLADAEIEILYTHEDYYPEVFAWGNDTSSAFRITLGNKEMIFLGDCDPILCQFMADVYGETLKCDILQLAHHGFNGAVIDLYQYCDPDICFWAVDEVRFKTDPRCLGTQSGYEFNKWIRDNSEKERVHYHASTTTTILLR